MYCYVFRRVLKQVNLGYICDIV